MKNITKWETYCDTEGVYVRGYLDASNGHPTKCFNSVEHTIDQSKNKVLEYIHKHHTKKLNKWKVFCDTENEYVYGYLDNNTPATFCFNNKDHILSKLPTIEETVDNNNVLIVEETPLTGGNLQFKSFQFDVEGSVSIPEPYIGSKTYFESNFAYDISMVNATLMMTSANIGDTVEADVGHHTTIGTLTEDVASGITGGVTGFGVSDTVMEYLNRGYKITLTDGVNTNELGACTFVDRVNKKISTEYSTTNSFSAATPTYVQQTVKLIDLIHIVNDQNINLGGDKIGASYVPASSPGRFIYTNNDGQPKKFTFLIEYLY